MGKYFGTDGFRGEVGVTLTSQHAFLIGSYLGHVCKEKKRRARVVIGKDTRRSSYTLEYALAAGLTSMGTDAHILHVSTTPSVSFVTRTQDFDLGVMISASHNPFADNGIKLFGPLGEKLEGEVIERLEAYLDAPWQLPLASGESVGRVVDAVALRNRYIGHLISLATVSYRGMRVGLDCANGAAFSIAKSVFDALGAATYAIHNEPDGCNINREAGSTHPERLQALVREEGLDVGFAFDGDADRCLAVDAAGRVVDGDALLYAFACDMKRRGELEGDTVVATVMSNTGLARSLEREGIRCEQTAVGDRYVYECMARNGYSLGGEQSGHIIFSKLECTGDGILTALRVMELLCDKGVPLHELVRGYVPYPQQLRNVRVKDKAGAMQDPCVCASLNEAKEALAGEGSVLVRASGTEDVIRVMVQAKTEEIAAKIVSMITVAIEKGGWTA